MRPVVWRNITLANSRPKSMKLNKHDWENPSVEEKRGRCGIFLENEIQKNGRDSTKIHSDAKINAPKVQKRLLKGNLLPGFAELLCS